MNLKSEYKSKLENIRGFYETGNNMPNLSDTGMLEILIDRELEEINAFYSKEQTNKSSKELTEYNKVQIWAEQLLDYESTDDVNFNEKLERVCKFVINQPQPIQSKEIEEVDEILNNTITELISMSDENMECLGYHLNGDTEPLNNFLDNISVDGLYQVKNYINELYKENEQLKSTLTNRTQVIGDKNMLIEVLDNSLNEYIEKEKESRTELNQCKQVIEEVKEVFKDSTKIYDYAECIEMLNKINSILERGNKE